MQNDNNNLEVLVQSNVAGSAASVSLPSTSAAVSETGDNQSEKRKSGLYNVSSK